MGTFIEIWCLTNFILATIAFFACLVLDFLIGENLTVYMKEERNKKGIAGWFLVSVVIGMLALPVMVAREIWQWKRYDLSHIEWDDVCRYGITISIGALINTFVMLCVC